MEYISEQLSTQIKDHADVIVAGGGRNARIVDILAGYVQDELS